jgi:hypothetical protein
MGVVFVTSGSEWPLRQPNGLGATLGRLRSVRACLGFLLALALGPVAMPAGAQAQQPGFVFEVPDGQLKGGARYSIRLQEIDRKPDELVLRVIQRAGPKHARRPFVVRGVCTFMARNAKKIVEMKVVPSDPDIVRVRFPDNFAQEELDDERRMFFTENLCQKLLAGPP